MKHPFKSYTASVVKDPETGETLLEFDQKFIEEQGWEEGDNIQWNVTDGVVSITNVDSKAREEMDYYLVESISLYRMRYVVKARSAEHAADEVVMNVSDIKEFSQHHIDEPISSVRKLTRKQVLELCDQDNDYLKSWSDELKLERLTNTIKYD